MDKVTILRAIKEWKSGEAEGLENETDDEENEFGVTQMRSFILRSYIKPFRLLVQL